MGTETGTWTRLTRSTGRAAAAALATVLGAALLTAGTTAPAEAAARPFDGGRTAFSGAAAPMGQTNGPVWTSEIAGGKVWVGGEFTSTRPSGAAAGSSETGQAGLAAFSASSGAPVRAFAPRLQKPDGTAATVWATALSPDKRRLYVGGNFDRVDGQTARRLAVFDTATGDFLGQVGRADDQGGVDAQVDALAVSPDGATLYVAGRFNRANFAERSQLAAFDVTSVSGGGVRAWAPTISDPITFVGGQPREALRVVSLAVSSDGDRVFMAGPFRKVNGADRQGFAATNASDGSLAAGFEQSYLAVPYGWGTTVEVAGSDLYLAGRDDGTSGPSRREGVYSLDSGTGATRWFANCYGDTFGLQVVRNEVYVASHAHDCAEAGGHPELNPRLYLAVHALNRSTGRVKPYFVQTSGATDKTRLLSRTLATDGTQLVMGGGFNRVNEQLQTNLTRFRTGSALPGPVTPRATTCRGCRFATVSFPRSSDRDDVSLTYRVYRGTAKRPVRTFVRESVTWDPGRVQFKDTKVKRGQKVRYRLKVSDPSGRSRTSQTRIITIGRP